jgi:predicted thioredoxin/glutaredoxin
MSIADLHDIAEKLHQIEQERGANAIENESVRLTRKLAINLVRELDWLSQRIDRLEGKEPTDI